MTTATARLETRLSELVMSALDPCDLGDGIEVLHDVEAVDVEMECSIDDTEVVERSHEDTPTVETENAIKLVRELIADEIGEGGSTRQFVRFSAPYERIEIQFDANAFIRATIEEAESLERTRRTLR